MVLQRRLTPRRVSGSPSSLVHEDITTEEVAEAEVESAFDEVAEDAETVVESAFDEVEASADMIEDSENALDVEGDISSSSTITGTSII